MRYALATKVIIQFRYSDTAENRELGRVGKVSGFRQATMDLRYVPANRQPRGRSSNTTAVRYYDLGRDGWRSIRKDYNVQVTISAFWDPESGEFVGSPEEAQIPVSAGGPVFGPTQGIQAPATDGKRETRTIRRDADKVKRAEERRAQRGRDRSAAEERKKRGLQRAIRN